MVVGVGRVTLRLHACHSLKEKRRVVKAVIARMRNHFNASVAEVEDQDLTQRAAVGFSLVGNDRGVINSKIDKLFNFVEDLGLAEVIDSEMEILTL